MPRNAKCRRICGYPDHWSFVPEDADTDQLDTVVMSLDEFETVKLIDRNGLTQEECAAKMGVARTTVTHIYDSARKKLATALADGSRLKISGGSVRLSGLSFAELEKLSKKGADVMRIAATYENGEVFPHFGKTQQFKIYDVENGAIVKEAVVNTNGSGHGALAGFLQTAEVDALICGGIGGGAQMALAQAGISLYAGVSGSTDEAAKALAEGRLPQNSAANCDHHGHHHGEDHVCGEHGCGHHGC